LVNASTKAILFDLNILGVKASGNQIQFTQMKSSDLLVYNTLDDPFKVIPSDICVSPVKNVIKNSLDARSVLVIKVPYK